MIRRLSIAMILATAGIAFAAPPTDDEISAAVKTYMEAVNSDRQSPDYRKKLAETAEAQLAKLDIASMSAAQFEKIRAMLSLAGSHRDAISKRLGELSKETNADGAMAGVMQMSLLQRGADQDAFKKAQRDAILATLSHPGYPAALKEGRGGEVFSMMGQQSWADWKDTDVLKKLDAVLSGEIAPRAVTGATSVFDMVSDEDAKVDPTVRESVRASLLAAVERAAKAATKPEDEKLAKYLTRTASYLSGPFAKGTLVGNPSPDITFEWVSNDRNDVKSIADLKGKVVVLDFWATWCGPCIASFPNVRKLAEHYNGYPVEIVGVTSIQGYHIKRSLEDKKTERIDCAGDPAKEKSLMPEFIKGMNMTWTVAFSTQDVFNPDFGVRGIPHVAILDSKGVVRYRGMHPGMDPEDKIKKINGLLKEAGLPFPADTFAPEKKTGKAN